MPRSRALRTKDARRLELLYISVSLLAGLGAGFLLFQGLEARRALTIREAARRAADELRAETERLRGEARLAAEQDAARAREALEREAAAQRTELARLREDLVRREATADARATALAATEAQH